MFERFTKGSRRVMVLCQDEARKLGHQVIAPHHIALGILRYEEEGDGLLARLGVNADSANLRSAIEAEAERFVSAGVGQQGTSFTSESRRVLELSLREALRLGHNFIGPGHILLALLSSRASAVLAANVDLDAAQAAVREKYAEPEWRAVARGRRGRGRKTARGALKEGSEELLFALMGRPETLAGKILAELGVTVDKVQEAMRTISEREAKKAPPAEVEIRAKGRTVVIDEEALRLLMREGARRAGLAERLSRLLDESHTAEDDQ